MSRGLFRRWPRANPGEGMAVPVEAECPTGVDGVPVGIVGDDVQSDHLGGADLGTVKAVVMAAAMEGWFERAHEVGLRAEFGWGRDVGGRFGPVVGH